MFLQSDEISENPVSYTSAKPGACLDHRKYTTNVPLLLVLGCLPLRRFPEEYFAKFASIEFRAQRDPRDLCLDKELHPVLDPSRWKTRL